MSFFKKLDHNLQPLPDDAPNSDVGAIHLLQNNIIVAAINVGDRECEHQAGSDACDSLEHAGVTGWRMGSEKDLEPMIDRDRHNPACDPEIFFWIKPTWYWTSRRYSPNKSSVAWFLYFGDGSCAAGSRYSECLVLAVRSGALPGQ